MNNASFCSMNYRFVPINTILAKPAISEWASSSEAVEHEEDEKGENLVVNGTCNENKIPLLLLALVKHALQQRDDGSAGCHYWAL